MALTITGTIAIKNVQKKTEQRGNFSNVVYYGILLTKEEFSKDTMELPFKLECREKQVQFYDNYLMQPGKSGFAKGYLTSTQNGPIVVLEKMEFGSFKVEGLDNGGGYQQTNNYNKPPQQQFQQPTQQHTQQQQGFGGYFNGNKEEENTKSDFDNAPNGDIWQNFQK